MDIMTERHHLRTAHCDLSGRLTIGELFLMAQEIAGEDSERLGFGRKFVRPLDFASQVGII